MTSPAAQVYRKGRNRFAFGVFTAGREQVSDAEVAIYAAAGPDGEAMGPFPARIESLETDPEFAARTTAADPDATEVIYSTELDLNREGEWRLVAVIRDGDQLWAQRMPSIAVAEHHRIPAPGDSVPAIHTPTTDDVADIGAIDTRDPHDTMHEVDFADVVGEKPVVLLFATPALCQSRVCGPVVDVAEQVKSEYGDEVAFIHMEIYRDNDPNAGLRHQVKAFGLPTEPWAFVIDRHGEVSAAIEGGFGVSELERAVNKVAP